MRPAARRLFPLVILTAAAVLSLPTTAEFRKAIPETEKIHHALARLTFGERPGDFEAVKKTGLKRWIEQQLHPESIAENPVLARKLKPFDSLNMSDAELIAKYPPPRVLKKDQETTRPRLELPEDPAVRRALRQARRMAGASPLERGQAVLAAAPTALRRQILANRRPVAVIANDLTEAKIYRAIYSNRQLEEVLADFWFNHFNVFLDKGMDRFLIANYEKDAIRPHVLGKFKDLLRATAQSPAMLFYLDNWQSVDPRAMERAARRFPDAARRARGLNENYGRELLELHTLGVDGGYTQRDVIEVARCFAGWTIRNPRGGGGFFFNARVHDRGEKTVLGVKIPPGGGIEDGLKVLDIVSRHPSTARFVSYKLAQRFVADEPPEELVRRMASTFLRADGDIREVLRTMFAGREFWSRGAYLKKTKSPLEMVVSAVRALDANVDNAFILAQVIGRMGEPLYRKQEPTGYSNSGEEWLNSASLVARMNFALSLSGNKLYGIEANPEQLSFAPGAETRAAIAKQMEKNSGARMLYAGLVLGSPDFQKR
ncbi:MAG: DUF1800 domain-containing protein [Bryobacterales bacterium]|nr:DUF1800 domain-containing protein [Bryobacterales bacterium]